MRREELVDLNAFATVAEEESFTRAAAKLGTSQSALSHTVRRLETRPGVRLLTRTTRRVAPTQAGERLLQTLGPALDTIAAELASLSELREKPAGTIRVTTSEHEAHSVLWLVLETLLPDYPDIHVELAINSGLTDIVAERFDAGVRLGKRSPRIWSRCASAPTCEWPWWAPRPTSQRGRSRAPRRTWPATSASTSACPPSAACMRGS